MGVVSPSVCTEHSFRRFSSSLIEGRYYIYPIGPGLIEGVTGTCDAVPGMPDMSRGRTRRSAPGLIEA